MAPTFAKEAGDQIETDDENRGPAFDAVDELLKEIEADTKATPKPIERPAWFDEKRSIDDEPKLLPGAAVISYILDYPDNVIEYIPQMNWEFFEMGPEWLAIGFIRDYLKEFRAIPTRLVLTDYANQKLTVDDPWEEVDVLFKRPSDPRETPYIEKKLIEWMKQQAYRAAVYSDQAMALITQGNYQEFHKGIEEAAAIGEIKSDVVSCEELLNTSTEYDWIVENVLLANQPMIVGGAAKTLKTSISLDMAISIASGTKFLGRYKAHKRRVLFISGESGKAALANTIKAIARERKMSRDDFRTFINFKFRLPKLTNASDVAALKKYLEKSKTDVVFIDPLYMCLLADSKLQAGNVFDMGSAFSGICNACQDVGCTPIFLHHFNRKGNPFSRPSLSDLSQAGSSEFCRQHILISRQKAYAADGIHDLYLVLGREGGCEHLDVRIIETDMETKAREWKVETAVSTVAAKESMDARKDKQMLAKVNGVLKIIADLMENKKETTSNAIKTEGGLNGSTVKEILLYGVRNSLIDVQVSEKSGKNNYYPVGWEVE